MPCSVLFVGAFPAYASLDRYVSGDLSQRLGQLGWDTALVSRKVSRLRRVFDILWRIHKQQSEYEVASVDVYSGSAFIWAELATALLRKLGKPYILILHGGSLPDLAKRSPKRVRYLLQSADAVTSPSRYLQEQLRTLRSDLILLPNGLDLTRYHFRERTSDLGQLIWLRAFHEVYNPRMAIYAVSTLIRSGEPINLTMVGPDKGDGALESCRALIRQLGLEHSVTIKSALPKSQVSAALNAHGLFVNTANEDNTPVSVLEAMASGLPVVSTRVGGIPYLLEHSKTGMLVPPNDGDALAEAVLRLLREPALAVRIALAAHRRVAEFDWPVILPKWQELLERVTHSEGRPSAGRQLDRSHLVGTVQNGTRS